MSWKNFFNPFKKTWWRKNEWVKVKGHQNAYKVVERHECPSWDLEFYFLSKYKHKETCEKRWRITGRWRMADKTIFKPPEEFVKDLGASENYYILMDNIEIYDGPDYEE